MRTLRDLAKEALAVQDASNPLGVSRSFGEAMKELPDALLEAHLMADTRSICECPVFRLWASKLHDMAGMGLSNTERYGNAYQDCETFAKTPEERLQELEDVGSGLTPERKSCRKPLRRTP